MNYQLIPASRDPGALFTCSNRDNDEENRKNQFPKKKYDLEERTALFGRRIVHFSKKIKETWITRSLISQLVRAGTSVGANYCEADDAHSKKDFIHKIGLCRKESRETKHWIKMILAACPSLGDEAQSLWKEAQELNLIFSSIINKIRSKTN
ncbi:MAG: four helix bundle protein [Candidatus Margulisiibacteriota bacterium]|nr:four helix bundle protein [Candidatus Margulisiibacteriota bacterium]